MNSDRVRQTFLDFFRSKDHEIIPSASMVIKDDPTLMFTNAGMNQFKDYFLGNKISKYPRIADTQKCLRVSGKHNDLEEVGHDTYHHTMFEMLGNWSFGDYFKKEAIEWGWELLTMVLKIDKDRLYVTVFGGDKKDGLQKDLESFELWKQLLPEERILFGSKKDNFWEMGDSGPCGPCSEIHIDFRDDHERQKVKGSDLVNTGNHLVIEIWNLVFIEFNRQADGSLATLPAKHVDTGMGFERLCMVLQGKQSTYDTDVFQPVIRAVSQKAGIAYGKDPKADIAMRVIADHLRAIAFAMADGQLPSNVKAGYVIRRILRRAIRYGYVFLDFKEPSVYGFIPVLMNQMGHIFPELNKQKELIMNVIREEETSFLKTLSTGIQKFNNYVQSQVSGLRPQTPDIRSRKSGISAPLRHPASGIIDGEFAFELYDTYGFPVDLTQLMAREKNWTVDMEGFHKHLKEQKARSRHAATTDTADWVVVNPVDGDQGFIGYDTLTAEVKIIKYRKIRSKGEQHWQLVLDRTPFYAESGGQVGDRGGLVYGDEKIEIENTVRENDMILHITGKLPEDPEAIFTATVDRQKRIATANNHSATHLLHAALRSILGTHVEQKGSLVDEDHLRFDFTHYGKMSREEIEKVEKLVNRKIRENIPLFENRSMPFDEAKKMGAMALFGEKYGDRVRVVVFDKDFSIELCGGTHVPATGQIGLFKIISEGAIAAGIRRVEAITAEKAEEYIFNHELLLDQVSELLKNPKDLLKGMNSLVEENQLLKKQAAELGKMKIGSLKTDLVRKILDINGIGFLAAKVDLDAESAKALAWELNKEISPLFLVLANEEGGKAGLTVSISDDLVREKGLNAAIIIRELAKEIQGGGGGQPHFATAGGKNPGGIPVALEKAKKFINT